MKNVSGEKVVSAKRLYGGKNFLECKVMDTASKFGGGVNSAHYPHCHPGTMKNIKFMGYAPTPSHHPNVDPSLLLCPIKISVSYNRAYV